MFAEYQPQQFLRLIAHTSLFPRRAAARRRSPTATSRRMRRATSPSVPAKSTWCSAARTTSGSSAREAVPGVKVAAMEPAELNALPSQHHVKPLDDIRVRQAIAHAIDRKAHGRSSPARTSSREAVSVVPTGNLGTDDKAPLYALRLAQGEAAADGGRLSRTASRSSRSTSTLPVLLRLTEARAGAAAPGRHQARHRDRSTTRPTTPTSARTCRRSRSTRRRASRSRTST